LFFYVSFSFINYFLDFFAVVVFLVADFFFASFSFLGFSFATLFFVIDSLSSFSFTFSLINSRLFINIFKESLIAFLGPIDPLVLTVNITLSRSTISPTLVFSTLKFASIIGLKLASIDITPTSSIFSFQ